MDIFTNLSHIDFSLFLRSAFILISSIIFACEIILHFASALSGGGEYGQVQMSMEVINDIYKEKLKNGFNRGETK